MSLNDIGSIANLLAAIGVLITLIYLARQVRQGNLLTKLQVRQHMAEQAQQELYQWKGDLSLRSSFVKKEPLSSTEQEAMHFFLVAAMRQREWEWFQYKDRVIKKDVYDAYHEVIALHLGIARTRRWWQRVGRIGFNAAFVADVDAFLATRPTTTYFEAIGNFDAPVVDVGPDAVTHEPIT
jgi:type II secretory pathway pseudopilin PulG